MTPLERASLVYAARGLGITPKAVLLCVAHHDGPEGARLSVATLAAETGASERTVQMALRELEGLGLLWRESRGPTLPPYYRIRYEALRRLVPPAESAGGADSAPPAESAGGGVQILRGRGAESAPEQEDNQEREPGRETHTHRARATPPPERGGTPQPLPPPPGVSLGRGVSPADLPLGAPEVWRAWTAAEGPFPEAQLNRERLGELRARLAEYGVDRLLWLGQWLSGEDDRAQFLRQRGDPLTPLRKNKIDGYLERADQAATGAAGNARARASPARPDALDLAHQARALLAQPRPFVLDVEPTPTPLRRLS